MQLLPCDVNIDDGIDEEKNRKDCKINEHNDSCTITTSVSGKGVLEDSIGTKIRKQRRYQQGTNTTVNNNIERKT